MDGRSCLARAGLQHLSLWCLSTESSLAASKNTDQCLREGVCARLMLLSALLLPSDGYICLPTCTSRSGSRYRSKPCCLPGASAGPGRVGTGESVLKSHCASQLICFPDPRHLSNPSFLHGKMHPQNREIIVVGWDRRRSNPLLKAGLLVLGIASSCQGFAPNNLYSRPVEGNTATRQPGIAALCLSHLILAFRHTLLFPAGMCPYLQ